MPIFKRTFSQDLDLLEQYLTKDILSQTDCKTTLKNLRTKFENAFNSEFKERMHKYTRFDTQSFKDAMICTIDSIGKYMIEIILHQQRTLHLLKQKKLLQTQEDHSNPIRALNVDSLKVDSVVIQNPYSETEDSNSETASNKSVKESSLDSATKYVHAIKYKIQMTDKYFVEYIGIEVKHFRDTLLQHMGNVKQSVFERAHHQRQYDRRVNKRLMQTQESKIDMGKAVNDDLVVKESSGTESEVQDDNRQQHTEQPEIINEGRVDQYPEQLHVKSPMFDSSLDNLTNDYSKQSLESENSLLKQTVAQFQKDFSRMEAHCIALELKYQNQALKSRQHGQVLNDESNKAKIKKEIDVLETINIELERKVANFRKENETLKKHYKDFYDSIKITKSKNIEQTTSLLANNAALKAQIQEKVFAIAALKNNLRKLKGTKFANTSVLGKPVVQPLRNQSVVRQPNASNDMVHNDYLDEDKKKTQERHINSKTSVMTLARFQSTTDDSKPKPRSTNHSYRSLPISKSSCVTITTMPKSNHSKSPSSFSDPTRFFCSTCNKYVFNANHYACITKLLKEVNSRAKIQSHKTRDRNKPVDQKSHTQIPGRLIFTGHTFSPNKTSAVYEKISPRSDLRWKPTGRIFKSVGLRWLPTGNLFDSCTSKTESEPSHGSNVDISNIHECKQTLDLSAGTSINVSKEQSFDVSAGILWNVNKENLRPRNTMSTEVPSTDTIVMTSMIELESLFDPSFDEYSDGENRVVSKPSAVTTANTSDKRQQQPDLTSSTSSLAITVSADGNFDLFGLPLTREICLNQELTYDYGYALDSVVDENGVVKTLTCQCGTSKCCGRLY
nr:histone-lysine N-methyltransferase, H3 lysine-9 specific SUVH4-like [Tanacetum cinerariifolium]